MKNPDFVHAGIKSESLIPGVYRLLLPDKFCTISKEGKINFDLLSDEVVKKPASTYLEIVEASFRKMSEISEGK